MPKALIFRIAFAAMLVMDHASFAADEIESTEYAYGTIAQVDLPANMIVIKEQDYNDDIETNVTYYLTPQTVFENVNSLSEVAAGNDVDVSYLMADDGKKIVKFISVYKPELEGEEE